MITDISQKKVKMHLTLMTVALCISYSYADNNSTVVTSIKPPTNMKEQPIGCICAVFLSGQFKRGSKEQPKGYPALVHEHPDSVSCNAVGNKLCVNKCLDVIVKHLPKSSSILCASIDRDCHKERSYAQHAIRVAKYLVRYMAYLFIKNCKDEWINTNLSAGREYCCKDGTPYKC